MLGLVGTRVKPRRYICTSVQQSSWPAPQLDRLGFWEMTVEGATVKTLVPGTRGTVLYEACDVPSISAFRRLSVSIVSCAPSPQATIIFSLQAAEDGHNIRPRSRPSQDFGLPLNIECLP